MQLSAKGDESILKKISVFMDPANSTNITWQTGHVNRVRREELLRQKGCVVWLTGLPSSGKS